MKKTVRTWEISIEERRTLTVGSVAAIAQPPSDLVAHNQAITRATAAKEKKKMNRQRIIIAAILIAAIATVVLISSRYRVLSSPVEDIAASVESPLQTFTVTNTDPSGPGSLAQAITSANGSAGLDTINFNVSGSGIQFFFTTATLPVITDPVLIDGTTQPGYAGTPLIHIEGLGISRSLDITGSGTTVKGLSFTSNSAGATNGILRLAGGGNHVVIACSFGVRGDSTRPSTSSLGVLIESNGNRVGGTTAAERNYFGVTNEHQLVIQNGAANNRVTGNWFGTAPNGTRLATIGRDAIRILNSPNNAVGGSVGTTPGGACTGECNVVAGAGNNGVFINGAAASGNRVIGNFVGLFAAGNTVNANNLGVRIENAPSNTVGGTTVAERNVITGNTGLYGVLVTGASSTGNVISGNYIGLFSGGTSAPASGNSLDGILLNAASTGTRIGGLTAGERNVISGLAGNGIEIAASNGNTVQGNYIGTDATGMVRSTTVSNGISIQFSDNNIIGGTQGTTLGGACTGACNVISGNGNNGTGDGIVLNTSNNNTIDGSYIGVNAAGTEAMVNGRTSAGSTYNGHAIALYSSNNNVIGRETLDLIERDEIDVPSANYCIQDPATGDYVSFNDNEPMLYFAIHCKSGRAITAGLTVSGTESLRVYTSIPSHPAFVRIFVDAAEGLAVVKFPEDGQRMYIRQPTPLSSSCSCPQNGMNVIGGPVQVGQTSEPATDTRISKGSIGTKANGRSSLNDLFETKSQVNIGSGIRTVMQDLQISSGDLVGIDINGGTGNTIRDVQFETQSDPVNVAPGANGGVPPPTLSSVRREYGELLSTRITGNLQGLPNTTYRIEFWGLHVVPEGPDNYYWLPIDFLVTTDANGFAAFAEVYIGTDAYNIEEMGYIGATATVFTPGANAGSTSEISQPSHVPVTVVDYGFDGRTDFSAIRAIAGGYYWYIQDSFSAAITQTQFGSLGDVVLKGDYNGDIRNDFAVWRPSTGTWYFPQITGVPSTDFYAFQWGSPTDIPVPNFDFDGDSRADLAVFRPSNGIWYIRGSLGLNHFRQWGANGDVLAPGDYNGDGNDDLGVFRGGIWYINVCPTCPPRIEYFGIAGDIPVPGDFDGDGKDDIGVFRPSDGNWYLNESMKGFRAFHWGSPGDIPLNIDIDADGKNDLGVWRPSPGDWWVLKSSNGQALGYHFGQNGDIPVPKF